MCAVRFAVIINAASLPRGVAVSFRTLLAACETRTLGNSRTAFGMRSRPISIPEVGTVEGHLGLVAVASKLGALHRREIPDRLRWRRIRSPWVNSVGPRQQLAVVTERSIAAGRDLDGHTAGGVGLVRRDSGGRHRHRTTECRSRMLRWHLVTISSNDRTRDP